MVKTTPQPADLSPIEQRILALCKRLQIEFARDGEPRLNMWVRIGSWRSSNASLSPVAPGDGQEATT